MVRRYWILLTIFVIAAMSGPAQAQDITTGIVALWKLDETSGAAAADSSGNANNGTYMGGPTLGSTAPRGTGVYFPSDNIYMTAPASATLNALGVSNADFSVAFWVKPAGTNGSWRPLFHKGSIDFERGPGVWLNPGDNRVHFRASTTANNNEGTDSATYLPTGSWSHIACVKNGNKWRCYINGILDTELTLSAGTPGNSGPVYIGDDPWYSGSNSYLDDVRLYSRALTAADIGVLSQMPVASRLLMVVVNSASLTSQETLRKTAFQDWGYTVTTISASASQATFDTSAAVNDVAYICETITAGTLSTKLTSKSLGIVNANSGMSTNLAIASSCSTTSATAINIDKNQHYITTPWSTGSRTLTTSSQSFMTISGTQAGDICSIGSISSVSALATVDIGGKLNDGTTAAGRRVQLPWGASAFDYASLNSDGQTLLSRSLAWAGGVVGYWKLDESSGTTASDASVNLFAGTLNNCTFDSNSAPAKVNTGLTMNGTTAYVNRANSPPMQLTKALSVSAWINGNSWDNTASTSWANVILRKGDSNPNNYQFAVESGYVALGLDGNDGSNAHGNTLLATGTWYHVVGTWDGTNIKIYVNGTLDNTASTHAAVLGTDARDLFIGGRTGSTDIFNGTLDDVRFYNHALGSDEIAILKTQGTSQGVHIVKWVEIQ